MRLLVLLFYLCVTQVPGIFCQNGSEIQQTFELLEKGSNIMNATEVVLVFGPTGCGKSTFVQWMTGNNTKLLSVRKSPGTYLIEDTSGKIGSSTVSKTLYPELVFDSTTKTSFYDFPGFSDTRSPSHDIAASFFMKSVMDHVEKVKMLFLTSYHSVQKGGDRLGFPGLLKNIDDLIGDVDKFNNSIALVVTKVHNIYIEDDDLPVLKSDSEVIEEIADFLEGAREDLKNDLLRSGISDKERASKRKQIKIISIFLTKEDGEYTRIRLFRRPAKKGRLSDNKWLTKEKVAVQEMTAKRLSFTSSKPNDFGFTISDNSKLRINSLMGVIDEQITGSVSKIAEDINKRLISFVEPVRMKIEAKNLKALSLTEAAAFASQTDRSLVVLSGAVHYFTSLKTLTGMGGRMKKFLSELSVWVPPSMEPNMDKFSKYFEFFQLFRENLFPISSLAWANSFQAALSNLTKSKQLINDRTRSLAEELNSQITFYVESISKDITADFADSVNQTIKTIDSLTTNSNVVKVNRSEAKAFYEKLLIGEASMTKLVESVKQMSTPQMLHEKISEALDSMKLGLLSDNLSNIEKKLREFKIIQKVSDRNLSSPSALWSNSFKTVVTFIQTQNILTRVKYSEEKVALNVDTLLQKIFDRARSIVDSKSNQIGYEYIDDELQRWHSLFSSNLQDFKAETTLKELILEIGSIFSQLNADDLFIRSNLRSLDQQEKYFGFLKSLKGDENDVIASATYKAHITSFMAYLDEILNFNSFIMELYEVLSKFEVQKDVSRYDVLSLADWGKTGHPQGIHVDRINFELFTEKVKYFTIKSAQKISDIIPSDSQLSILNDVLTTTLKKRVNAQCPETKNSTVTLKANFIKFSDFLDSDGSFKECGWEFVSFLEIYALNTLFIDRDLIATGEKLKLSIVATKWEVIGNRKVKLDGKMGEPLPKAANGIFPRVDGRNGLAGLAGGSAGAFFGVADMIVTGENLTVSANGGEGGPGQSGGDGANGQNGETPPDKETCYMEEYEKENYKVELEATYITTRNITVLGTNATRGGNAGSCGPGGEGGLRGEIFLRGLTETSKVVPVSYDGEKGRNGTSGKVGSGGRHGDSRVVECVHSYKNEAIMAGSTAGGTAAGAGAGAAIGLVGGPPGAAFGAIIGAIVGLGAGSTASMVTMSAIPIMKIKKTSLEERGSAPDGVSSNNCSSNILASPLPARNIQNGASFLSNFKNFSIANSNERFVGLSTRHMIEKINTNPEIRILQDTLELVEEYKMIGSFSHDSKINLVPFYEMHLANIENYAANLKASEKSLKRKKEYKKVLSYLYTATLIQISNLKSNRNSDLVTHVFEYLDIVSKNLEKLSALKDEARLVTVVNTLKNNFKGEIDQKIAEAQSLIESQLNPEYNKVISQFDDQMLELLTEINTKRNATINEKATLMSRKAELQRAMVGKAFLKIVNVVAQVSAFCGPPGMALSAGVLSTTSVVEEFIHDKSRMSPNATQTAIKLREFGISGAKLYTSIKSDLKSIDDVTQEVEVKDQVLDNLEKFKISISEKLVPLIDKMSIDFINTANSLQSKSSVSLDVAGWQVQGALKATSRQIQQFTRNFEVHESVVQLVENLEEVMNILIKVYDRIQDYQEQQRLAVLLADLSSASVKNIVASNPMLSNSFRELEISIQSNIILSQYNLALNAFKQWIFPFAKVYLENFQLPKPLISEKTDIEALVSTAVSQIEGIKSKIQEYKTTITKVDDHIFLAEFNSSSTAMRPFYVWKNEDHRNMITKLLAGEKVYARADVTKAERDAVKFKSIELSFKSKDLKVEAAINEHLLNYCINMTHLGNSNYRFKDQFFSIDSSSVSIYRSFEEFGNARSLRNNIHDKLFSGDILLSPYTLWEFQLIFANSKSSKTFEVLSQFSDKVDLILEGSGSFVQTEGLHLDVERYYKTDDSIKFTLF